MKPQVSIIIPVKNEERRLKYLFESLTKQSYKNFEVVVNDDYFTTDNTKTVIERFNKYFPINHIYKNHGMAHARKEGSKHALGVYLLHLDADMYLSPKVLMACVSSMEKYDACVIPEKGKGGNFWANVKAFEKSMYVGDEQMSSLRFIKKSVYEKLGGHNQEMVFSEDKDLHLRVKESGYKIAYIDQYLYHLEWAGLLRDLRKKYYYGRTASKFIQNHPSHAKIQANLIFRNSFIKNKNKIIKNPAMFGGLILLKSMESIAAALGYISDKVGLDRVDPWKSDETSTVLVGHVSEIVGPGHHLKNFLIDNIPKLEILFFPMPGTKLDNTMTQRYHNKKLITEKIYKRKPGKMTSLLTDYLKTVSFLLRYNGKINYYFGLNNFDTFSALPFKHWRIKNLIYYGSDFADQRFSNKPLNFIYRTIEKIDLKYADLVISNTKRAGNRRIELGLSEVKSMIIPNGVDLGLIPKDTKRAKYDFVYVGYLSKTHGVPDLVDIFSEIVKDKPNTRLALIGSGPEEDEIKESIKQKNLSKNIHLLGKLKHIEVLNVMKRDCLVGLASYNTTEGWTKYASPLKVKEYLACGLVVIMSDVPEISEDIKRLNMGYVYSNNDQLQKALKKLTKNTKLIKKMSRNAKSYIADYDWNKMYSSKLLPYMRP